MDKRKIVIVGASHGGHESAIELLDKYNDVDVTVYEAGDFTIHPEHKTVTVKDLTNNSE